ncbi:MAG: alpha/beta hydrolase [Candidatus Kapaibacterium sp.]
MMDLLMVPGLTGSGAGHWQTLWRNANLWWGCVEQRDWDNPEPEEWMKTLDRCVARRNGAVVLVAHSLGCLTVARWAGRYDTSRVAGAVLVAPCDADDPGAPAEIKGFSPMAPVRLPFPSLVIASNDDPWISPATAEELARGWGSRMVSIGEAGHINTASGHGEWPEGLELVCGFVDGL